MKLTSVSLYPFALAAYPVFTFASSRGATATEIMVTLVLAFGACGLGWGVAGLARRSSEVRVAAAGVAAVFFGYFGFFQQGLQALGIWLFDYIALGAWVALTLLVLVLARRVRPSGRGMTRFLNRFSLLLLAFPVFSVIRATATKDFRTEPMLADRAAVEIASKGSASIDDVPNIVFLVVDKFSSSRSLRESYGVDLDPFVEALRGLGFVVPVEQRVNYIHTRLSLASMLNWTHLDDRLPWFRTVGRDLTPYDQMVKRNRAMYRLRLHGYRTYFFPTHFHSTKENVFAEAVVADSMPGSSDPARFDPVASGLLARWLLATPVPVLIGLACRFHDCLDRETRLFPYPIETAAEIEAKLERIVDISKRPGPLMIFAHLMLPHEPYLYDGDCRHRTPYWPIGDRNGNNEDWVREAYADQVRCFSTRLLTAIEGIVEQSDEPPIIVIQGDHGHGRIAVDPLDGRSIPFDDLDAESIRERATTFAAYLLPNGGGSIIYDDMTPINLLPLIFRYYFGWDVPLQSDQTFWSDYQKPFEFRLLDW